MVFIKTMNFPLAKYRQNCKFYQLSHITHTPPPRQNVRPLPPPPPPPPASPPVSLALFPPPFCFSSTFLWERTTTTPCGGKNYENMAPLTIDKFFCWIFLLDDNVDQQHSSRSAAIRCWASCRFLDELKVHCNHFIFEVCCSHAFFFFFFILVFFFFFFFCTPHIAPPPSTHTQNKKKYVSTRNTNKSSHRCGITGGSTGRSFLGWANCEHWYADHRCSCTSRSSRSRHVRWERCRWGWVQCRASSFEKGKTCDWCTGD